MHRHRTFARGNSRDVNSIGALPGVVPGLHRPAENSFSPLPAVPLFQRSVERLIVYRCNAMNSLETLGCRPRSPSPTSSRALRAYRAVSA